MSGYNPTAIYVETIKCMLNNSTWVSPEIKSVYSFVSGCEMYINGQNFFHYSINLHNDKIELKIGTEKKYNIEYVNDFILKLYNSTESFRIMPE